METNNVSEQAIVKTQTTNLAIQDIEIIDETNFEEGSIELTSSYWGTQDGGLSKGDKKLVYFVNIDVTEELDAETGELEKMKSVSMISVEGGTLRNIRNSSAVLVSNVSRLINSGLHIDADGKPRPFIVTYLGKEKGKNFSYDNWSIKEARPKK